MLQKTRCQLQKVQLKRERHLHQLQQKLLLKEEKSKKLHPKRILDKFQEAFQNDKQFHKEGKQQVLQQFNFKKINDQTCAAKQPEQKSKSIPNSNSKSNSNSNSTPIPNPNPKPKSSPSPKPKTKPKPKRFPQSNSFTAGILSTTETATIPTTATAKETATPTKTETETETATTVNHYSRITVKQNVAETSITTEKASNSNNFVAATLIIINNKSKYTNKNKNTNENKNKNHKNTITIIDKTNKRTKNIKIEEYLLFHENSYQKKEEENVKTIVVGESKQKEKEQEQEKEKEKKEGSKKVLDENLGGKANNYQPETYEREYFQNFEFEEAEAEEEEEKAQKCQKAQQNITKTKKNINKFEKKMLPYFLKNVFTTNKYKINTINSIYNKRNYKEIKLHKRCNVVTEAKKQNKILANSDNNAVNNNKYIINAKKKNECCNNKHNKERKSIILNKNYKILEEDMEKTIDFHRRRRRGRVRKYLPSSGCSIFKRYPQAITSESFDSDTAYEHVVDQHFLKYLLSFLFKMKLLLNLLLNAFVNKRFEIFISLIMKTLIQKYHQIFKAPVFLTTTLDSIYQTNPANKSNHNVEILKRTPFFAVNMIRNCIVPFTFMIFDGFNRFIKNIIEILAQTKQENKNQMQMQMQLHFEPFIQSPGVLKKEQHPVKAHKLSSKYSKRNVISCPSLCLKVSLPFLLCLSIMMMPYNFNMASAAKPKSATQLQQKPHQQHTSNHNGVYTGSHGLTPPSYHIDSPQDSDEAEVIFPPPQSDEQMVDEESFQDMKQYDDSDPGSYENQINNASRGENVTVIKTPLFPKDLFTKEQLENGAVICHIFGVIYMFVALAIVCDEFFVPSLDVIIEKLGITDDVAGATFMAAGGSAPELFTSVIGVFVSFDDVGIGTIVGSAVFNILFVIGMCALFSKTVLSLTWWPLFRDCSFYSISLLVLIYFFRDSLIYWWEALILFSIYAAYVAFMKWNVQVESCVKKMISKNKVTRVRSTDQLMPAGNAANSSETSMATQPGGSVTSRAASETRSGPPGSSSGAGGTGNSSGTAGSTQTGAKFRHGLLQLMIHTIDPLHDGKVDEKATQLHAIASLKVLLDATKPQRGGATTSAANHVKINLKETTLADRPNGNIDTTLDSTNEIEEEPEPLSMAWPDTARKRLTYVLVAPLLIPMWLTLPDTRTPKGKKLFPITFIGSIVWIAAFSYLMVWWANVAGDTAGIPPEVMGLTFLAAGTSIPDLITSVIVARKGFGDMAVSSSVGSNIFDVTVGLPIPWLLYGIFYGAPVQVNSVGMVCSITILFMMLIFVVMSIACFRWRMNKGLGFTMFLLYFVFVAVSLMFEYDAISCPV